MGTAATTFPDWIRSDSDRAPWAGRPEPALLLWPPRPGARPCGWSAHPPQEEPLVGMDHLAASRSRPRRFPPVPRPLQRVGDQFRAAIRRNPTAARRERTSSDPLSLCTPDGIAPTRGELRHRLSTEQLSRLPRRPAVSSN
jgi:hypothetical protein